MPGEPGQRADRARREDVGQRSRGGRQAGRGAGARGGKGEGERSVARGGEDGEDGQRGDPASRPSHPNGESTSIRDEHHEARRRDGRRDRVVDQRALHERGRPEDDHRELPGQALAAPQTDRDCDQRDNPEQRAKHRRLVGAEREHGVDDPLRAAGWRDDVDSRQHRRDRGDAEGERGT